MKYFLSLAMILFSLSSYAQTKVEIVSRIANTNVSGQLAVQFIQKLNEAQSDYEFRFFTVPGSAGEGAYQRMITLKSNVILYGNQSFFSNPKTNINNRVEQIHFLTSHTVSYAAFMINPDSSVNTIDEFVTQMKERGGFYAGSINSSGGGPVLTSIFLDKYKLEDKVKIVHYKNVPDRVRAVFIKEADFMINNPASANVAEKGTLKIIAMSSPTRQPDYPTVPTGAELGFPEFNFGAYTSFAVLKSEKELIAKIQPLFDKVCNDPDIKKHIIDRKYVPVCINDEAIKKMIADEKKMFIERGIDFDMD